MENKGDIGIAASTADMTGLQSFPFRMDRLVVVAPVGHPLATRMNHEKGVLFAEILTNDFVGLADGSALLEHLAKNAEQIGARLKYRVRLRNYDAICEMVQRKVGISILPETAALRFSQTFELRVIPLNDAWASREPRLCVRKLDHYRLTGSDSSMHSSRSNYARPVFRRCVEMLPI